jgi:hypothetical protein
LSAGVFGDLLYAVIIAMSLLTSIIAPPFLALLLKRDPDGLQEPVASR